MSPLELITSPDPVPLPPGPFTPIVTTDGRTLSATGVTGQEATEESPVAAVPGEDDEDDEDDEEAVAEPIRPAPTPTTTNAAASAAHFGQRRRGRLPYRSPGPASGLR
jgi:hypothetical protein